MDHFILDLISTQKHEALANMCRKYFNQKYQSQMNDRTTHS